MTQEAWQPTDTGNPPGRWGQVAAGSGNLDHVNPPSTDALANAATPGVSALGSPADHVHGFPSDGTPTTAAIADVAANGTAASLARSDHRHGFPASAVPVTQAFGDSASAGTATTLARSDHRHGMPANPVTFGAASGTEAIGTAENDGVATSAARADHQHANAGDGTPVTQVFGDTASNGAQTTYARSDHRHGMPVETPTRGGSILTPSGAINIVVWRAPYACTVTNVRGFRKGGTGATVNARRNGGGTNHLSSDLSLTSANTWMTGVAPQDTAYSTGDYLEIMLTSISGSPTEIDIQVDFTHP